MTAAAVALATTATAAVALVRSSGGTATERNTPSLSATPTPGLARTAPAPRTSAAPQRRTPPPRPALRVPRSGTGEFVAAPVEGEVEDVEVHFSVEVERGLPFDPRSVARTVVDVLGDDRGWQGVIGTSFAATAEDADLRILLATPATTDRLCAPLVTRGRVSCRNGDLVVLNARRWAFAIPDYDGRARAYRRYLVNHEVGHYLGRAHEPCPGPGEVAPVMMQQTYGLAGCTPNGWPGS